MSMERPEDLSCKPTFSSSWGYAQHTYHTRTISPPLVGSEIVSRTERV